ncbi:uncharacterized protein LOC143239810 [Tachypleus tridentatus]|uniref:uncharacterized protein LOC143239810 n=1 Tax=Tachypleus tridentatus TaxID=6853 RepID=UPI003FCF0BC8
MTADTLLSSKTNGESSFAPTSQVTSRQYSLFSETSTLPSSSTESRTSSFAQESSSSPPATNIFSDSTFPKTLYTDETKDITTSKLPETSRKESPSEAYTTNQINSSMTADTLLSFKTNGESSFAPTSQVTSRQYSLFSETSTLPSSSTESRTSSFAQESSSSPPATNIFSDSTFPKTLYTDETKDITTSKLPETSRKESPSEAYSETSTIPSSRTDSRTSSFAQESSSSPPVTEVFSHSTSPETVFTDETKNITTSKLPGSSKKVSASEAYSVTSTTRVYKETTIVPTLSTPFVTSDSVDTQSSSSTVTDIPISNIVVTQTSFKPTSDEIPDHYSLSSEDSTISASTTGIRTSIYPDMTSSSFQNTETTSETSSDKTIFTAEPSSVKSSTFATTIKEVDSTDKTTDTPTATSKQITDFSTSTTHYVSSVSATNQINSSFTADTLLSSKTNGESSFAPTSQVTSRQYSLFSETSTLPSSSTESRTSSFAQESSSSPPATNIFSDSTFPKTLYTDETKDITTSKLPETSRKESPSEAYRVIFVSSSD